MVVSLLNIYTQCIIYMGWLELRHVLLTKSASQLNSSVKEGSENVLSSLTRSLETCSAFSEVIVLFDGLPSKLEACMSPCSSVR